MKLRKMDYAMALLLFFNLLCLVKYSNDKSNYLTIVALVSSIAVVVYFALGLFLWL